MLILFTHIAVYEKDGVLKIISDIVFSAALIFMFISVKAVAWRFEGKITKTVLILVSLIMLLLGVILTPYSPCHDVLDLHNILNNMINNEKSVYYETYMNFWINNKLTVYCYMPFVNLFKNVVTGVRFLNLFGNVYIPYYYRANINDWGMDISKNLDLEYFLYQNSVLIMFFVCMIINMVRVIRENDFSKGVITATGLSAIAVIIVFLLLTEVSKKYMFDFYVPMALSVILTFSGQPRCKNTAALLTTIAAAAAVLSIQIKSCQISIFHNAQTRLLKSEENCVLTIDMKEKCEENYSIRTYSGEYINLNGKQSLIIHFPDNCFNAFTLYMPNGERKYYSSQNIN